MYKRIKKNIIVTKGYFFILLVLILVHMQMIVTACPNCKEGFDASSAQASAGGVYSYTILFMLLIPVLAITTIVLKVRAHIKRKEVLL